MPAARVRGITAHSRITPRLLHRERRLVKIWNCGRRVRSLVNEAGLQSRRLRDGGGEILARRALPPLVRAVRIIVGGEVQAVALYFQPRALRAKRGGLRSIFLMVTLRDPTSHSRPHAASSEEDALWVKDLPTTKRRKRLHRVVNVDQIRVALPIANEPRRVVLNFWNKPLSAVPLVHVWRFFIIPRPRTADRFFDRRKGDVLGLAHVRARSLLTLHAREAGACSAACLAPGVSEALETVFWDRTWSRSWRWTRSRTYGLLTRRHRWKRSSNAVCGREIG